MKKMLLVLTGLCAVYLLWDVMFVDTFVVVNGAPVTGVWGAWQVAVYHWSLLS